MAELAPPSAEQRQSSATLSTLIAAEIQQSGGIDFARYMHLCLYQPELGYYQNGFGKLGAGGDFTTAAEMSADFAGCLAEQCAEILAVMPESDILEFGGGSGQLACDVLNALEHRNSLPERYLLLDVSAELRSEQQQTLAENLSPAAQRRVHWLSSLPDSLQGVVIANELFDAFPVQRFEIRRGIAEQLYVMHADGEFRAQFRPEPHTAAFVQSLQQSLGDQFEDGYQSEYCPVLLPWWQSVADMLSRGVVLASDYGQDRRSCYGRERSGGTLRCFFRHQVHDNPFIYPGIQDMTADVDFTAVTEAATATGFELQGYTSLAQFMLSLNALESLESRIANSDMVAQIAATGALKRLILPQEMGERFKVIGFSKGVDFALQGFGGVEFSRLL